MLWGILLYVFSLTIYAAEPPTTTAPHENTNNNFQAEDRASSSFAQLLDSRSSLPVVNNHFVVDKDISEIEIILTTKKFNTIKLISPLGKTLIPSDPTTNITWQRIEKLYAIKIQNPPQGQWEVQGEMLSRPEVVVTSSLNMITPIFPNNVLRGETLALSAYLQQGDQRITSGDLLKSMQIIATLQNVATSEVYKIYLIEDEKKHLDNFRGLFHYDYRLETLPGIYMLDIKAIGILFQRERQQQFYVHDYPAKITTTVTAVNDLIQVDAVVDSPALDIPTSQLSAVFHNTDGSAETVIFDKKNASNWQVIVPYNQDIDSMTVTLAGYMKDMRPVQVTFPVVNIEALYEKSYYELQQSLELKSRKSWQNVQEQALATVLPFSIEKQREKLILAMNPFDEKELIPIRQYATYEQELIKTWQPTIYPKSTEEILGIQVPGAKAKVPVITKEQIQAKELALAKAKAQEEKIAAYMHKRKILLSVFGGFCFIFILMLAAIIWIFVVPHRKIQPKAEQPSASVMEPAPAPTSEPAPVQEVAAVEEPIESAVNVMAPDMKEDINVLFSDTESKVSEPEKPNITEVINVEAVENEQEIKKEIKSEKEEIKIDLNQVELTEEITQEAPQEAPQEAKEETKEETKKSDQESVVATPPKEPPQGDQPTV
jgi:uncharacterized protein (TIGR03503 family)